MSQIKPRSLLALVVGVSVLATQTNAKPRNPLDVSAHPSAASGPLPRKAAPGGMLELPTGGAGRILTSRMSGTASARKMLTAVRLGVAGYFSSWKVTSAFADRADQNLQAAFTAKMGGMPVRGVVSISMQGESGQSTLLFDRASAFQSSFRRLAQRVNAAPTASGRGRAPAPVHLTMTPLLDGSGQIGLPPGWRVTGSYKGTVDAVGPNGAVMGLGGYAAVTSPQTRGLYQGMAMVDFNDPVRAALDYGNFLSHQTQGPGAGMRITRVIDSRPVTGFTGRAAFVRLSALVGGRPYEELGLYSIIPTDTTSGILYMSYVVAPTATFKQQFPGMWAAWQSWGIKDEVFRERLTQTLKSMRETGDILTGSNANTQATYAHVNNAWDATIRDEGVWKDPEGNRYTGSTQTFAHNQPIGNLVPVPIGEY